MGWFSAEIVTVSTLFNRIDLSTVIFSFSYYLIQLAVVADIILRKKLSILGIFLIGILYGILEEAFYIKNPFFLTLLLALGHSAVTVTFPYLLTNFLIPGEKRPFLGKIGYILSILYLLILYVLMAGLIPFAYPDSLILGSVLIIMLILIKKYGQVGKLVAGLGLKHLEKTVLIILASLIVVFSQQNDLGVILILIWFVIRGKMMNLSNLYFFTYLFLIFHFLASFINKTMDPSKIAINYAASLIAALTLIFLLWRKRRSINTTVASIS